MKQSESTHNQPIPNYFFTCTLGARGVLRDVFRGNGKLHDFFNVSQSNLWWEYKESVFSDYQSSSPARFSRIPFIDRFRGFFVPPRTDYYTVNVFADGECVLYVDNSTIDLALKPSSRVEYS